MHHLSSFSSVGFGGSRSASASCLASFYGVTAAISPASVLVSCCRGASAVARGAFPSATVFAASAYPGRASHVRRSVAMLRALAASPSPVWVCAPGVSCPSGLSPSASSSRCWGGFGSGSWSECALSFGLGVPVFVVLPSGIQPPASWGAWSALGSGWYSLTPAA